MDEIPDFLQNMLEKAATENGGRKQRAKLAPDIEAIRLRDSLDALMTRHDFVPGMIVRQKRGSKLYRGFGDNDHAIVVEVLAEPLLIGMDREGSPHFRERNDMIVGSFEDGGSGEEHFCLYHVDSRRFEPVPEEELKLRVSNVSVHDTRGRMQ